MILFVLIIIIIGIVAFFINHNKNVNNMETQTQTQTKTSAKDFFINLGAIIALGFFVGNLLSLLFTVINKAYPLTVGYNYYDYGSSSISFPVAALIIFFPVFILLMWLLERGYSKEPEKRNLGIRKWLTYITLFLAGLTVAGDLVTVLYYFIDGRDITTGFILKALSILVISIFIFFYYISDVMGKLNGTSRKVWAGVATLIILCSVIWGFSVLGSPRTQQLLKYDEQKVYDLQYINGQVQNFYANKKVLPKTMDDMMSSADYYISQVDPQTGKAYEYKKVDDLSYELCAVFNKPSVVEKGREGYTTPVTFTYWQHKEGEYCFKQTINLNMYTKTVPMYQ